MFNKNPFIERYDINFFIEKYIKENLSEKEKNLFSNFPQFNRFINYNFAPYIAEKLNSIQSKDIDKFGKTKLIQRGERVILKNGQSTLDTDVSLNYLPLSELQSQIDPITILQIDRIFNKMNERGVTSELRNTLQKQAQNVLFFSAKKINALYTVDKDIKKLEQRLMDYDEGSKRYEEIQDQLDVLYSLKEVKKEPVIEIDEDNLDDVQKVLKELVPLRKRLWEEFDSKFKPIKDFTEEEQRERQQLGLAISNLNKELIDLYAKQMDWEKKKLIESSDIANWLKSYGIFNRSDYGKEVLWDFIKLPYVLLQHIMKLNKNIKAKRRRAKKNSFNSIDPRYNDIVRAVRKGKADRNKDHEFVSTTHAFKMMGGLAKWGSYGEGVTLNKLINKKDQIERGKKLSDFQRRELDFEIDKINNYTPKRANPSENWVQGVFKEMDSKGTRGAFSKYCKAKFGATTVQERKKCADKIIKDFENWQERGERGQSPFTMKTYKRAILYRNLVNLPRQNPKQLSLFQKKNPDIDESFDAMGKYVESNLNSKEYNLYDSFYSSFNAVQRNVLMFMYGLLPKQEEEESTVSHIKTIAQAKDYFYQKGIDNWKQGINTPIAQQSDLRDITSKFPNSFLELSSAYDRGRRELSKIESEELFKKFKEEEEEEDKRPQHVREREERVNRYFREEKPFYLLVGANIDRLETEYTVSGYTNPIDFLNNTRVKYKILKIDTTSRTEFPYGKARVERLSHGDIGEKSNMGIEFISDYIYVAEKFIEKQSTKKLKTIESPKLTRKELKKQIGTSIIKYKKELKLKFFKKDGSGFYFAFIDSPRYGGHVIFRLMDKIEVISDKFNLYDSEIIPMTFNVEQDTNTIVTLLKKYRQVLKEKGYLQ